MTEITQYTGQQTTPTSKFRGSEKLTDKQNNTNMFKVFKIENGNGECVKETTTRP